MSPWTALLESLHSALIDEVTDRHPDPKPELGLPLRQNRFALPLVELEQLLIAEISFGSSQGIGLLASETDFMRTLGLSQKQLWDSMLKRSGAEFLRRQIQPKLSPIVELQSTDAFPASTLRCARVIWIPIRIPAGACYFGIGV